MKIEVGSKSNVILSISRVIPFIQVTIIGLLILITLQIILTSQYLTSFYVASLGLSWSTEDIMGFSLCPEYSKKQLRRMVRLKIERAKYGHGRSNAKGNVIRGLKTTVQYPYANTADRGVGI